MGAAAAEVAAAAAAVGFSEGEERVKKTFSVPSPELPSPAGEALLALLRRRCVADRVLAAGESSLSSCRGRRRGEEAMESAAAGIGSGSGEATTSKSDCGSTIGGLAASAAAAEAASFKGAGFGASSFKVLSAAERFLGDERSGDFFGVARFGSGSGPL